MGGKTQIYNVPVALSFAQKIFELRTSEYCEINATCSSEALI